MTVMQLEMAFKYNSADAEQQNSMLAIREAAKTFAEVILANVPKCADQSAALRKVREAQYTANAAVMLKGLI
jgi:hypothetical protein